MEEMKFDAPAKKSTWIRKEQYISPEKEEQIINGLRLV